MKLDFQFEAGYCLLKACYKQHHRGFIKREDKGRFHAIIIGITEVEIHYDKYVENYHVAVVESNKLKREKGRLRGVVTESIKKLRDYN